GAPRHGTTRVHVRTEPGVGGGPAFSEYLGHVPRAAAAHPAPGRHARAGRGRATGSPGARAAARAGEHPHHAVGELLPARPAGARATTRTSGALHGPGRAPRARAPAVVCTAPPTRWRSAVVSAARASRRSHAVVSAARAPRRSRAVVSAARASRGSRPVVCAATARGLYAAHLPARGPARAR